MAVVEASARLSLLTRTVGVSRPSALLPLPTSGEAADPARLDLPAMLVGRPHGPSAPLVGPALGSFPTGRRFLCRGGNSVSGTIFPPGFVVTAGHIQPPAQDTSLSLGVSWKFYTKRRPGSRGSVHRGPGTRPAQHPGPRPQARACPRLPACLQPLGLPSWMSTLQALSDPVHRGLSARHALSVFEVTNFSFCELPIAQPFTE